MATRAIEPGASVASTGRAPRSLAPRAALALVAAAQAQIGVWGVLAPHSLYVGYPGAGHHWIAVLGPYDEHLVRDFASGELGLAVLLACAAVWFERRLVLVAAATFFAAELPHLAYHLTTTDSFSTADDIASLGGFVIELGLVAAAAISVGRERRPDRRFTAGPAEHRGESFADGGTAR
jgi:hypothetical protein